MGRLQKSQTMARTMLILAFAVSIHGEDSCQEITLSSCRVEEDNRVDESNLPAEICEKSCKLSDNCHYWRALQNATMELPQCLHLRTNYHNAKLTCEDLNAHLVKIETEEENEELYDEA